MRQPQHKKVVAAKVASVSSVLVMSLLPILYASLLHLPPAALARDTTFWFLLSNSIIAIIAAADSAAAPTSSSSHGHDVDESPLLAAVPAAPAAGGQLPAGAVAVQDDEISRDAPSSVTAVVVPSSEEAPAVTSWVMLSSDDPPAINASDVTIEGEGPEQPQEAAENTATNNHGEAVKGDGEAVKGDDADEAASETTTMNKCLAGKEETHLLVVSPSSSSEELAIVTYNDDDDDDDDSASSFGEEDEGTIVPWRGPAPATTGGSRKQYWQPSDEELNRKVEWKWTFIPLERMSTYFVHDI